MSGQSSGEFIPWGTKKEGLTGKHPCSALGHRLRCRFVGGFADLIAQSQGYSDSGNLKLYYTLNVKKQRQLSLSPRSSNDC